MKFLRILQSSFQPLRLLSLGLLITLKYLKVPRYLEVGTLCFSHSGPVLRKVTCKVK